MTQQNLQAEQALQTVPFFTNLKRDETIELASHLVLRHFNNGQVIFHHGDPGGLLYIISKGKVKITHSTPEGQEALCNPRSTRSGVSGSSSSQTPVAS